MEVEKGAIFGQVSRVRKTLVSMIFATLMSFYGNSRGDLFSTGASAFGWVSHSRGQGFDSPQLHIEMPVLLFGSTGLFVLAAG